MTHPCGTCGTALPPGHHGRCQGCGSLSINVGNAITVLDGLRLDLWEGLFRKVRNTVKEKIAGASQRRAHQVLTIDRTDPDLTVKYHRVQEYDDAGHAAGDPHEHIQTFPARRRPSI
jgi:hypothetical protein